MSKRFGLAVLLMAAAALVAFESTSMAGHHRQRRGCGSCGSACAAPACAAPACGSCTTGCEAAPAAPEAAPAPPAPAAPAAPAPSASTAPTQSEPAVTVAAPAKATYTYTARRRGLFRRG